MNYENLVKTGWSHSKINELPNANTSRFCDTSRIDKNGKEILRSKTMYTIAKKNDKWGLVLIASLTPFVKQLIEHQTGRKEMIGYITF